MTQEIKPAYVTFEQAKWLKEKGFDERCNQYYSQALFEGKNEDWEGVFPKFTVFEHSEFHFNSWPNSNDLWFKCSAPEQHQVVEWLRVNHGIWVYVVGGGNNRYYPMYQDKNQYKLALDLDKFYDTPQEAYSAAFDYILINNLI